MQKRIAATALAAMIATACMAQADGQRVSRECRQEIVKLCLSSAGRDRSAIRSCLMDKRDQLSDDCKGELRERMQQRGAQAASAQGGAEYAYGPDARQKLDFYAGSPGKPVPLVVFVHGGGWSIGDKAQGTGTKPKFYNQLGYAFASLNYRLVPNATPSDQARDIASALAFLRRDAAKLGFDPDHIVLMGHSAGAHLVALVSSDTRYLAQANVPLGAIKGSILLDGAGYDVAKQMQFKQNRVAGMYEAAFTNDPATQKSLSPITYAAAPNTSRWLILHVASRDDSGAQSNALASALKAAGASVIVKPVPDSTHMTVNRDAGSAGTMVGNEISAFLGAKS
jgi:arylformamidase